MKIIALIFAFIVFMASCKKETPIIYKSYPIQLKFSRWKAPGTKLVISDFRTGEVLYNVTLPPDSDEFIGTFEVRENLVVDTVDMHIVSLPASDYVETYAAVPVGALVHSAPFETFTKTKKTYLSISEINSFDTLTAGYIYPGEVAHDPVSKKLYAEIYLGDDYGCLLRAKANNSSDFKYYYLPDTLAGDTVQLNWADFKEETDFKPISFSANLYPQSFRVDAVSPDFSKAISIHLDLHPSSTSVFNLPDILPSDWLLHVKMSASGRICDHIYTQQEPLVFHSIDMKLEDLSVSGNQIFVSTSGEVDWISLTGEGDFKWTIHGAPDDLKRLTLPDLSLFLTSNMSQNSLNWDRVVLKQFDQHNAVDIRAGIPNSSPGFFPTARSGYREVMY